MISRKWTVSVVMVVLVTAKYQGKDHQNIITERYSKTCSSTAICRDLFARQEGFEVGHTQYVQFKGKQHQIVTLSLRPLIFEIPEFLSDHDCDRIVELAKRKGLEMSKTLADESSITSPEMIDFKISRYRRIGRRFANHLSSVEKMTEFINQAVAIYPWKADAENIFKIFDANNDNNITEEELFMASDKRVMQRFYVCLEEYKSSPLYRSRYSSQAWLPMRTDKLLKEIEEKIVQVIKLPKHIVENSEDLQVVHYSVDGHFYGHYDSTDDEIGKGLPCCKELNQKNCHLCRYITILFFLNNVTLGGETVFPVADAKQAQWNQPLNSVCQNANIVIKPKKGTAIFWYNHHLDSTTGLLGNLDLYSLHGGCNVLKGSKWIANRWINIPK